MRVSDAGMVAALESDPHLTFRRSWCTRPGRPEHGKRIAGYTIKFAREDGAN